MNFRYGSRWGARSRARNPDCYFLRVVRTGWNHRSSRLSSRKNCWNRQGRLWPVRFMIFSNFTVFLTTKYILDGTSRLVLTLSEPILELVTARLIIQIKSRLDFCYKFWRNISIFEISFLLFRPFAMVARTATGGVLTTLPVIHATVFRSTLSLTISVSKCVK